MYGYFKCSFAFFIILIYNFLQSIYTAFVKGGALDLIRIQPSSTIPIYEQIAEQMKTLISNGILEPGAPLPSIRALAKELKISVITTKRAYTELEQEGFIETIASKGSFVVIHAEPLWQEQLTKQMEVHIEKAIGLSKQFGLSKDKFAALFDILWEDET